ncbi:TadE/TadG family type IV pilus assembly protein [Tabrizicola sp.]|uniref:TadE/TadG family type IV pilus assembly protein n=1 Tax=Tabrizicola sp. TaxID=2005166 RepID=UPI003D2A0BB6
MIRSIIRKFGGFGREDKGTAAVEFAMAVPLLLTIFMASFESGFLMVRSIMLEQSVDVTMRSLRLGHYPLPTAALLKDEICSRSVILKDCDQNITIEMIRVNTSNWALPTNRIACVNREEDIVPVTQMQIGQQNDMMLVRVCVVQDAIFPTTGVGLGLPKDSEGGYGLVAVSAFVVEPN